MYPPPTRIAGLGIGVSTLILLRVSASRKDCCTTGGAPSPTAQHGAITIKFNFWLATPSLAAVTLAAPPPTAFNTAVPLALLVIVITRLLVVLHDTGRSLRTSPPELIGVAVKLTVSPRFRVSVAPTAAPLICTVETGGRIT